MLLFVVGTWLGVGSAKTNFRFEDWSAPDRSLDRYYSCVGANSNRVKIHYDHRHYWCTLDKAWRCTAPVTASCIVSVRCQFEMGGNLFYHVGPGRQSPPSFIFSLHAHARLQIHLRLPPYAGALLFNPSCRAPAFSSTLCLTPPSARSHACAPVSSPLLPLQP